MAKGTIVVNLRRDWFAPNGTLYESRRNPHEFPADWEDQIPGIMKPKRETTKAPIAAKPEIEYEVDEDARDRIIVEDAKIVETQQLTANGSVLLVPTAVEEGVKSVGNTVDETTKGPADHNKTHQSTTVSKAVSAAKDSGAELGAKPKESGPLPSGKK